MEQTIDYYERESHDMSPSNVTIEQAAPSQWWVTDAATGERIIGPFMKESSAVNEAIRLGGDHLPLLEAYFPLGSRKR